MIVSANEPSACLIKYTATRSPPSRSKCSKLYFIRIMASEQLRQLGTTDLTERTAYLTEALEQQSATLDVLQVNVGGSSADVVSRRPP
jgi:hypothetical protein